MFAATTEFEILNFARPLDVHTWSDYPEVNTFVELIFEDLKGVDGNRKNDSEVAQGGVARPLRCLVLRPRLEADV